MKKILILITFILGAVALNAQTVTISEEIVVRDNQNYFVIGKYGEFTLFLLDRMEGAKVYAFNGNMQIAYSKEVEFDKKDHEVLGVIPRAEDFSLVYSFKEKGQLHVRLHQYNPSVELQDTATIKIYKKEAFTPALDLISSHDRNSFVIFHSPVASEMEATAFDVEKKQVLWDDILKTGAISISQELRHLLLGNGGDFMMIFNVDNKKSKRETNRFDILRRNPSGLYSISVNLRERLVFDHYFEYDNKNKQLVGAGLFSTSSARNVEGSFYLRVPLDTEGDQVLAFETFDKEFMTTIIGKEAKENSTFSNTIVNKLVVKSDGGVVLCAERYVERTTGAFGGGFPGGGSRMQRDFNYDDIIVISYTPEGRIQWKEILYKRQYSYDDDGFYSSYFLAKTPTSLRFLYNDAIKSEISVSEYLLGRGGEPERQNVLHTGGFNISLIFKNATQISANEVIVPSIRKRWLKLVRISY